MQASQASLALSGRRISSICLLVVFETSVR